MPNKQPFIYNSNIYPILNSITLTNSNESLDIKEEYFSILWHKRAQYKVIYVYLRKLSRNEVNILVLG